MRFPKSNGKARRHSFSNKLKMVAFRLALLGLAWGYAKMNDTRQTLTAMPSEKVRAADGDSFVAGDEKVRLTGIDAPELNQICKDEKGTDWPCGKASHKALSEILSQPSLTCEYDVRDRFGRLLATCSTRSTKDIAAAQVASGLAISHKFNGIRDYPKEEDAARKAKTGIWRGNFDNPKSWRDQNPQSR